MTQANKIIKYILLLALAAMIVGLGYYFSGKQRLFTGSVLTGAQASYINSVEFSAPAAGTAVTPDSNSHVTIESVFVDFKNCANFISTDCPTAAGCTAVNSGCSGRPTCADLPTTVTCNAGGCTWTAGNPVSCSGGTIECGDICSNYTNPIPKVGCLNSLCQTPNIGCYFVGTTCNGTSTCSDFSSQTECNTWPRSCTWSTASCSGSFNYSDGVVYMPDSSLTFQCTDVQFCSDNGITITNNVITVPPGVTTSFSVDILVSDSKKNTSSLIVTPVGAPLPTIPTIDSINPSYGLAGTSITITGTNFNAYATVTIGGTSVIPDSISAIEIIATVPADLSAGPQTVVVTNPDTMNGSSSFTVTTEEEAPVVYSPTITNISPYPALAGTNITITGTNFDTNATVKIGSTSLTRTVNGGTITATVPAGLSAGTYSVVVTNPDSGTVSRSFIVASPVPRSEPTPVSDCSGLKTSIMKATGEGMFMGDFADLPTPARSLSFDFPQVIPGTAAPSDTTLNFSQFFNSAREIATLEIKNPVNSGVTPGSKQFTLTFNFSSALTDDFDVHNCDMATGSVCAIDVKSDTAANAAINFTAAINAIGNKALSASRAGNTVTLTATESAVYTNNYTYKATMDNVITSACGSLGTSIACAAVSGCAWNPAGCTGDLNSCANSSTEVFCNGLFGCTWDDTSCTGNATCNGTSEAACESWNGCTWSGSACEGTPACAAITDDGLCDTFDDCAWDPAVCAGTPAVNCGVLTTAVTCESETDAIDCAWNNFDSECVPENPVIVECLNCFTGGIDAEVNPIESIILSNTTPPEKLGQRTFNISLDFVTCSVDGQKAEIISSGGGDYQINVCDKGLSDTVGTASDFIYVFNNLLGGSSPFFASADPSNSSRVILTTRELGTHTNNYNCNINGNPFPSSTGLCFSGAAAGSADILVTPLVSDNSMNQGDAAIIYIMGSTGDNEWKSVSPSVIEVALPDEIGEGAAGTGTAELLPRDIGTTPTVYPAIGSYVVKDSECTETTDPDSGDILTQTCPFEVSNLLVRYPAPNDGTAIVLADGETYEISVQFGGMEGYLSGTGIWEYKQGIISMALEGDVTGTVTGSALPSTGAEGMIYGTVKSHVTLSTSIDDIEHLASSTQIKATLISHLSSLVVISGTIEAAEPLSSTVTKVKTVKTDQAVLYAKHAGTSTIIVTDSQNCSAAMDVEVVGQKVILQMVDRDPGEMFEVGEPEVQINAYAGTTKGEILSGNIAADDQITWASSNQAVATIDATGSLKFIGPGATNITAKYNTGAAEIGQIKSDPLTIRVNKVTGLTIALNKASQDLMPAEERNQGYVNCALVINTPEAAGGSVMVEGQVISITLPASSGAPYANDIEKVKAIAANIKSQIPATVDVMQSASNPGVLLLLANAGNTNGIVDIASSSSAEKVTILPNYSGIINLPATKTYGLMILAQYEDGRTKLMAPTAVTSWVNTPVNYLDTASLPAGILKFITGTNTAGQSQVQAKYLNADGYTADSNVIYITVQAGPVIEYLHRIGVAPIQKGSELALEMLVSDIDTIADIQDFNIKIVDANNPANIFDSTAFTDINDIKEAAPAAEGEPESTAPYYRIYTVPVTIPDNNFMSDGNYFISITITDKNAHSYNFNLPIYIGAVIPGDVAGGGTINFLDVYRAFQISNKTYTPTPAEFSAADIAAPKGVVNFMDVYAVFKLMSQS